MTENRPPYKRRFRNFLINPKYELKYVGWLILSGATLVAVNAAWFYRYVRENYEILVDLNPMTDASKILVYEQLNHVVLKLCLMSTLFLLFSCLVGLFFVHRTAGPLYQFKKVFQRIRQGDQNARISLRPKDDFQDVAQDFNQMIDEVLKK